jgi:two-component system NtrC family sensor kinase
MVYVRQDGEIVEGNLSSTIIYDAQGKETASVGIFVDLKERLDMECKLRDTQEQLLQSEKLAAMGRLTSQIAHELNNPLMASQTILHVIFNNLHENCPNRDRLKLIRKCNNRIQKIVEHLREFSRQERPKFQKLDINQPIENALLITEQQLLDHNISVVKRLAQDLPSILGDSNQLEQVFLNLITNAMDAMDPVEGQKQLTLRSETGKDNAFSSVEVSINDTGGGIPPENLDKVFEPFFSTKPVGRGTGLGLSLSFGIIEAHGGKLGIKSQAGKGTEVKIILPAEVPQKE